MQIISINSQNPDVRAINQAADVLRAGGIIIYPTDTTYGLGVDPSNPIAMNKLLHLKGRDITKGVSLILKNLAAIEQVAITDLRTHRILEHFLPDPYSFLLVNKNFTYCPLSAVMVRIPLYPVTQVIANTFIHPYTTTSANFSGELPAYSRQELEESLLNPERMVVLPDLFLDAGPLPHHPPSTIVDLTSWPPKILRQGEAQFDWQDFA